MKFGIVEISSGDVVGSYEASSSSQSSYGGPWGDSSIFAHIVIPQALENIPVQNLVAMQLEEAPLIDECGCPIFEWVPGESQDAFTSMGEPILDHSGKQVKLRPYSKQPKLGSIYRIVQR